MRVGARTSADTTPDPATPEARTKSLTRPSAMKDQAARCREAPSGPSPSSAALGRGKPPLPARLSVCLKRLSPILQYSEVAMAVSGEVLKSATAGGRLRRNALIATAVGSFLEWYDFFVYGTFATVIAVVFFPGGDPVASFLGDVRGVRSGVRGPASRRDRVRALRGPLRTRRTTFAASILVMVIATLAMRHRAELCLGRHLRRPHGAARRSPRPGILDGR